MMNLLPVQTSVIFTTIKNVGNKELPFCPFRCSSCNPVRGEAECQKRQTNDRRKHKRNDEVDGGMMEGGRATRSRAIATNHDGKRKRREERGIRMEGRGGDVIVVF